MTAASGGDLVYKTGGYKYHVFQSSGNLVVTEAGDIDFIIVAGGGGGGGGYGFKGGAGGAGGAIVTDAYAVTVQTYPIVVGALGARATSGYTRGSNGGASTFDGLTAVGGGGGGRGSSTADDNGSAGGSGGGGGRAGATPGAGGAGTAGQGYAGSNGIGSSSYASGGPGGGATGVGFVTWTGSGYTKTPGPGVTWHDGNYYAEGGDVDVGTVDGPANSGNGGSGGTYTPVGDGGSGIAIFRYEVLLADNVLTGLASGAATGGQTQAGRYLPHRHLVWVKNKLDERVMVVD